MKRIMALGIDISKNVFELCGLDKEGNKIYQKTVKRADFVKTVQKLSIKTAYMEACGSTNQQFRYVFCQALRNKKSSLNNFKSINCYKFHQRSISTKSFKLTL